MTTMADLLHALVTWALRRRTQPDPSPDPHDVRLDALEHDQAEIDARLKMLEMQADIRGERGRG